MLRLLIFLALASAAALGAVWLAERPGEVSIVWGGVTIETSVAIAAIAVLALVLAGMLLWTVLRFLLGLPTAFSFASKARKRARGFDAVSRGMVAIGSGDPAAARRHAADARKLISDEPLTLLLSAQSAQLSGDKPAAEAAFKDMLEEPSTRVLGLRGLFVEARRRGDQVAARAFADEAVRLSPSLAWANDALLEYHSSAGQWAEARIAVERRAALRLSDKTESRRHRAVLLAAEAQQREESDPTAALATALEALKLAPDLTPAAEQAGRLLAAKGEVKKAARVIEAAWREQPHPGLAGIYVHLRKGDSALDRLAKAEALRKLKPTDAESAFAVAEAAIAARDFPRARAALQPIVAAIPTVRTCLLMADIEDAEHGSMGRAREWLTRSIRAPRDNAWVADGLVSERWLPVSPVSGRLDAFVWTLPPAVLGSSAPVMEEPIAILPPAPPAASGPPPEAAAASAPDRPATTTILPPPAVTASIAADTRPEAAAPAVSSRIDPVTPNAAAEPDAISDQTGGDHAGKVAELALTRLPDDPGPESDNRAPPARRSFWGWQRA
jgi:HemY protein